MACPTVSSGARYVPAEYSIRDSISPSALSAARLEGVGPLNQLPPQTAEEPHVGVSMALGARYSIVFQRKAEWSRG